MSTRHKLPRPPKGSTEAIRWQRYYSRCAKYWESGAEVASRSVEVIGIDLTNLAVYGREEAARFRKGAQMLKDGTHPLQISGEWK